MGMYSEYIITEDKVTASSYLDDGHVPNQGRIQGSSSWVPG